MRTGSSTTLIVGGDGKVGRALEAFLKRGGHNVLATTRRPIPGTDRIPLDLSDCASWEPPDVRVAVLTASVTGLEACQSDPVATARVNVSGMLQVARRLRERGTFLIYLSSSAVFDGETPCTRSTAPMSPRTEYGCQKAIVEQELRTASPGAAIVRLGKILHHPFSLLAQWEQSLRTGQVIEPFQDMVMAPIPMACVVATLALLIASRQSGIYQVTGERDVSYAQAAFWLAEHLGARLELVRPVSARGTGRFPLHLPRHATLDTSDLRTRFGFVPPAVEWSVRRAIAEVCN